MKKNFFENISKNIQEEIIEILVENQDIRIERIISKGQKSPEGFWYNQNQNEFVLLLKGYAIIEFENRNDVELKSGDFLIISTNEKHRVKYTNTNNETIWLTVFYD